MYQNKTFVEFVTVASGMVILVFLTWLILSV